MLRSRLVEILNVPLSENKLSRHLGVGGWEDLRLRFQLACGLAGRTFWASCPVFFHCPRQADVL